LYLENKSSNYVSFDQSYSPDTTKESGIIEHEITKQTKTKSLPLNFSGLDTFENTIISPFESLTDFSADLQKQTNDLLKNPTVLDKLVEIVGALKIDLPVDQLDYKKINGKLIDSLLLHIIHNHYKTDSGANFFEQNNLGFNNLSPLSLDSPKDVSFAKRYKMLSKLAKQEGVNLVKEFPVLKFFKSFFRPGSDYYTFIFSAGSNLTTLQKDEFKADLVDLLNYNHSNIEFATEVRNLFSEMLETLYVTTGFQFFEGNIAPIIPSSVYRTKVTKAIEEFLNQPYAKLKESLKHFTGNFLLYNYGEIALGEYTTESQKSFNIYNIKFADYGIKDPAIELSKGEQFFMDSLNSLPNNGLYLQLIEKICN
jgi:hypothetical protein